MNLLGCGIAAKEGKKFAAETLRFMLKRIGRFQRETGNLYNLEATPAEGVSYRLAKIDKRKYPNIITAGEKAPYYTNSTCLPVNSGLDLITALRHQEDLQTLYTGGCIEKGNKVLTNKGLLNIEYIVENFSKLSPLMVASYNPENGTTEWDEVIDAVAIDVKKDRKIKIRGEKNFEIVTSDWHPFFALEKVIPNPTCPVCGEKIKNIKGFATHLKWNQGCEEKYKKMPKYLVKEKRADELKIKDYILQNSTNLYPNSTSELNDDLMWLIGFFVGDGCISKIIDNRGGNNIEKYMVRFFSGHQKPLEKVVDILAENFGCKVKILRTDKRSKCIKIVSTSKRTVSDFLFKLSFHAGEKTHDIGIPEEVKRNITKDNVYALLSGLIDSDGSITKRDGDIEYCTVSTKLADDILEICSRAGIMVSKKLKATKRKKEMDIWRLRIPSYEATRIKNNLHLSVNSHRINDTLSDRWRRRFPVVRVKNVSKADVEDNQFYDLTTQRNHNYLAGKNSLVFVHNTVFHIYLGESLEDGESCKNLIRKVASNTKLPYFTVTPTYTICDDHGFIPGEYPRCPSCGKEAEVYSRVVGYFRPVRNWNAGKQEEFRQRVEYS